MNSKARAPESERRLSSASLGFMILSAMVLSFNTGFEGPINSPMPIEISTGIQVYEQEEFHALDRRIMGVVFDIHNDFGRLLDEEFVQVRNSRPLCR